MFGTSRRVFPYEKRAFLKNKKITYGHDQISSAKTAYLNNDRRRTFFSNLIFVTNGGGGGGDAMTRTDLRAQRL